MSSESSSSSSDSQTITVNIKSLEQKENISISVPNNLPVSDFKKQIEEKLNVPTDKQRIIFRGKVLQDSHRLSDFNLEDGQTVHLVTKRPSNEGSSSSASSASQSSTTGSQQGQSAPSPNDLNGILSSVFNSILPGAQSSVSIQARQNEPRTQGPTRRVVINRRPQPSTSTGETISGTRVLELVNQLRNTFRDQGNRLDQLSSILQRDTWSQEDTRQIQQLARELAPLLGNLRRSSGEASEALGNLHLGDRLSNSHAHRSPARTQQQPPPPQFQPQNRRQPTQNGPHDNLPISGIQLHVHANSNELDELPNRLQPFINDLQQRQGQQQQQQQQEQEPSPSQPQNIPSQQSQSINLGGPPAGQQGQSIPVGSASITIVSGDDESNIGDALRNAFQQQQQQQNQQRGQQQQQQQSNSQQESSPQRSQSSSSSTSQSQSSQSAELNLSELASSLLGAGQTSSSVSMETNSSPSTGIDISSLLRPLAGTMTVTQIIESFLGDTQNISTIILRTMFRVLTMDDLIDIISGNWSSLEKARDPLSNTIQNQLLSGDTSWNARTELVQRHLAEIKAVLESNSQLKQIIAEKSRSGVDLINEFLSAIEPHISLFYELILKGNNSLDTPYNISSSSSTPFTDCLRLWIRDVVISIIDMLDKHTKNGRTDTETLIRTAIAPLFERAARNNPQLGLLSGMGPSYFTSWIMSFYDSNNQSAQSSSGSRTSGSDSSSSSSASASTSSNNVSSSSSSSSRIPQQSNNTNTPNANDWQNCLSSNERQELESFLSQDTKERQQGQNQELSEAYRSGSKSGGGGSNQSTIDQSQQAVSRRGNNGGREQQQTSQNETNETLDLD